MQYARIDADSYGRKYVREIIPSDATPLEKWYPADFVKECVEATSDVRPNMLYDSAQNVFYEWVSPDKDFRQGAGKLVKRCMDTLNEI